MKKGAGWVPPGKSPDKANWTDQEEADQVPGKRNKEVQQLIILIVVVVARLEEGVCKSFVGWEGPNKLQGCDPGKDFPSRKSELAQISEF